jgi:hypothetical protein
MKGSLVNPSRFAAPGAAENGGYTGSPDDIDTPEDLARVTQAPLHRDQS